MTRHFLRDDDLSPAEQAAVLDLAEQMKKDRFGSVASGGTTPPRPPAPSASSRWPGRGRSR